MSSDNQSILATAGEIASSSYMPWLIAGDFNLPPATLQEYGFPHQSGDSIVVYPDCDGTCLTTGGMKMNDYFV
eukprot:1076399-Pyramimonas_sp.AAC.1